MSIVLVAIGYNRKDDYKRLIESLIAAEYGSDSVDLVMSIDNSGSDEVESYARTVEWRHGSCTVRTFEERQGLKKHILSCGAFTDEYDAVAIFEDDIVVSPAFYSYVCRCLEKYSEDDTIAGISLYGDLRNKHCQLPFTPQPTPYDVYFTQNAQSWGQVWMKRQWHDFLDWLSKEEQKDFEAGPSLPQIVNDWGENSWLKYHLKYCADNGKFFVSPYASYTTCFASVGEHTCDVTAAFQVPLIMDAPENLRLPVCGDKDAVYYDAFFERMYAVSESLGIAESDIKVDLYGLNTQDDDKYKFILTSRVLPYKIVRSYGRLYRPHEQNIILSCEGNELFLYDTSVDCSSLRSGFGAVDDVNQFIYYHYIFANTNLLARTAMQVTFSSIKAKIKRKWGQLC